MLHPRRRLIFLLLAALALPAQAHAAAAPPSPPPLRIVVPALHPSSAEHAAYFPALLRLALDKTTASDGPYQFSHYEQQLTSPRQASELKNNGVINVIWDGTNRQRETDLLPVRISLLGQLNDYRVLLIRAADRDKFRAIRNLDQLRKLTAGAGVNWPSVDVLRANGLPVVTSIAYEYLFPMLAAGRFDYMPRGVYEAWYEQRFHEPAGLAIEEHIFLHYRLPFYFFVSRDNPALAQRIERGLTIALKDGSFDKLFNSFPAFKRSQAEIRAGKRLVFELQTL